jgi:hypothetical protein
MKITKKCPVCSLISLDEAQSCDCGYSFVQGRGGKKPIGWFSRLLGKKPGLESWWNITGLCSNPEKMNGVMEMLADVFARGTEVAGIGLFPEGTELSRIDSEETAMLAVAESFAPNAEVAGVIRALSSAELPRIDPKAIDAMQTRIATFLMYLDGHVVADLTKINRERAEDFVKAIVEQLALLSPPIDRAGFEDVLAGIIDEPLKPTTDQSWFWDKYWPSPSPEGLSFVVWEHVRQLRTLERTKGIRNCDYMGALVLATAQMMHRTWLSGRPRDALHLIEGIAIMKTIHEAQQGGDSASAAAAGSSDGALEGGASPRLPRGNSAGSPQN